MYYSVAIYLQRLYITNDFKNSYFEFYFHSRQYLFDTILYFTNGASTSKIPLIR